jgi:hypothetical protein
MTQLTAVNSFGNFRTNYEEHDIESSSRPSTATVNWRGANHTLDLQDPS